MHWDHVTYLVQPSMTSHCMWKKMCISWPGHKALHNLALTSFTSQTLLGSLLRSLPSQVFPSLSMLHFALLAPWNVLPRSWHDSFFLSFESHLLQKVPLRYELHTSRLPHCSLGHVRFIFLTALTGKWSCLLISLVPCLASPTRMSASQRQDLVCPVLPISRARTGLGIW